MGGAAIHTLLHRADIETQLVINYCSENCSHIELRLILVGRFLSPRRAFKSSTNAKTFSLASQKPANNMQISTGDSCAQDFGNKGW